MKITKTVIKGALYFDEDRIVMPHSTGEFSSVDGTEYKNKIGYFQRIR